jgi:hypothetical protein
LAGSINAAAESHALASAIASFLATVNDETMAKPDGLWVRVQHRGAVDGAPFFIGR